MRGCAGPGARSTTHACSVLPGAGELGTPLLRADVGRFDASVPAWRILDGVGMALFAISWIGAGLADRQLYRFKRLPDSKGRVCRVGLWAWSRHPNYFFEWIHWLGWTAIAVGSSLWWVPLLGAGVMLFFLLKVTGVPVTEKRAVESKGDAYRAYQREVSVFVPLPPRRSDSSAPLEGSQHGEHSHG
jgi:steroid 5-alpha reductase family enzyme